MNRQQIESSETVNPAEGVLIAMERCLLHLAPQLPDNGHLEEQFDALFKAARFWMKLPPNDAHWPQDEVAGEALGALLTRLDELDRGAHRPRLGDQPFDPNCPCPTCKRLVGVLGAGGAAALFGISRGDWALAAETAEALAQGSGSKVRDDNE